MKDGEVAAHVSPGTRTSCTRSPSGRTARGTRPRARTAPAASSTPRPARGCSRSAARDQEVLAVAVLPGSGQVLAAGLDPQVSWYDPKTAERAARAGGPGTATHEIAIDPKGTLVATAGGDGTIRTLDPKTGDATEGDAGRVGGVRGRGRFRREADRQRRGRRHGEGVGRGRRPAPASRSGAGPMTTGCRWRRRGTSPGRRRFWRRASGRRPASRSRTRNCSPRWRTRVRLGRRRRGKSSRNRCGSENTARSRGVNSNGSFNMRHAFRLALAFGLVLCASSAFAQPRPAPTTSRSTRERSGPTRSATMKSRSSWLASNGSGTKTAFELDTRVGNDPKTTELFAVRADGVYRVKVKDDAHRPAGKVLPTPVKAGDSWEREQQDRDAVRQGDVHGQERPGEGQGSRRRVRRGARGRRSISTSPVPRRRCASGSPRIAAS